MSAAVTVPPRGAVRLLGRRVRASARTGPGRLTVGTLASGVLAYAFNAIAARTMGPGGYGPVAVLWATTFLTAVILFRPLEQVLARGIAERLAAGLDARGVLRSVAWVALALALACGIVVFALRGPLTEDAFGGSTALTVALGVALAGYAGSFLVRGIASGLQWLGGYGALLLADGAVRAVIALGLVVSASAAIAGSAVAGAAIGGAVVPLAIAARQARSGRGSSLRARLAGRPGPPFRLGHAVAAAVPVAVLAAAEQLLVSGGSLLALLHGGPNALKLAGTVFAATMLVRAPVFLFHGVAAGLLPGLTTLRARGDDPGFRRAVSVTTVALAAFAAVLGAGALAVGPQAMRLLYGPGYGVARDDLALLALGVGCFLAASTFSQAALATHRAGAAAGASVVAGGVFVAVEQLASGGTVHRVSVAFAVAAVLDAALMAVLLMWRRRAS